VVLTDSQVDFDPRVLLDDGRNLINVVGLILACAVLVNLELSVGCQCGTVAVGQVVDDKGSHQLSTGRVLRLDVGQVRIHEWDLRHGVHPHERPNLSDCRSCWAERCRERGDGEVLDFRRVVWVGVEAVAGKRVRSYLARLGSSSGLAADGSCSIGNGCWLRQSLDQTSNGGYREEDVGQHRYKTQRVLLEEADEAMVLNGMEVLRPYLKLRAGRPPGAFESLINVDII
jgi:hypothetical protein